MSGPVVGDFDFEDHCVAFSRSAVAAGQSLNGNQIGFVINDDFFFKIIAGGARIRLVTHGRSGDVGDGVAALAHINGSDKRQRC